MTEKSMICPTCHDPIHTNMQFCPNCGSAIPTQELKHAPPTTPPQSKRRSDVLGGLSAGIVLILLAITYLRYPVAPETVILYIQRLANQRVFLKPPVILLSFSIFFFYASGVWGFVLSTLRLLIQRTVRQTLTDLLSAVFSIYCGYLLTNYLEDTITSQGAFAYFIVGLGLLIIGNAVIYLLLKKHSNH